MSRYTVDTGTQPETLASDPWVRRRNPTTWGYAEVPTAFLFDRGYTGHQHLDRFGLINMNGRVYDPALARFLSPDPFIANPANSQNYNRYSYCLNNPLKYTDPSGYNAHEKPWDWDMEPQFAGPFGPRSSTGGWNGWSNPFAGAQAHDFVMMSSFSFNNVYGKGASDIGRALYNDPAAFAQWSAGKTSIETVRQAGGFYTTTTTTSGNQTPVYGNTGQIIVVNLPTTITLKKWNAVQLASGQGGSNQWSYNETVPFVMTGTGNTFNLIGTAAEYAAYEARALSAAQIARNGINGIKTISLGASVVGGVLTVAVAGYEYKTGQANTHTFVDVGVSALGFAALGVGVILAAPGIAVGAAAGGLIYGLFSACGMSTTIDNASGNWGKNLIYGR